MALEYSLHHKRVVDGDRHGGGRAHRSGLYISRQSNRAVGPEKCGGEEQQAGEERGVDKLPSKRQHAILRGVACREVPEPKRAEAQAWVRDHHHVAVNQRPRGGEGPQQQPNQEHRVGGEEHVAGGHGCGA